METLRGRMIGLEVWGKIPRLCSSNAVRHFCASKVALNAVKKPKLDLTQILKEAIKSTGPLPLSSYMKQCLLHPDFGYYTTRDPLGATGDFVTSPEISQTFGEMIGIWFFAVWRSQGAPQKLRFIEFGPGKGTLMFDTMKTFNRLASSTGSIPPQQVEILMVEASEVLREEQKRKLCSPGTELQPSEVKGLFEASSQWGNKIKWLETELDITKDESYTNFILAHEFFDALPILQFEKTKDGWREYLVDTETSEEIEKKKSTLSLPNTSVYKTSDLQQNGASCKQAFHMVLAPFATPSSSIPKSNARFDSVAEGSRIEICPEAFSYSTRMAQLINRSTTGAALIIDYGPAETIPINTLRGIKNHKIVSPFVTPGEADLSADVDFGNLVEIFSKLGCKAYGPVEQGDFLHEMGIAFRTDQLAHVHKSNPAEKEKIVRAYQRLVGKSINEMGGIYKFLGVLPGRCHYNPVGFGGKVE